MRPRDDNLRSSFMRGITLLDKSDGFAFRRRCGLKPKYEVDTPDDWFEGTSLAAKWTAVSGSAGTVSLVGTGGGGLNIYDLATRPGALLMQVDKASDLSNRKVELRQDYTLADETSIIVSMAASAKFDGGYSADEIWAGLWLNDNNGGVESGMTVGLYYQIAANNARLRFFDGSTTIGILGNQASSEAVGGWGQQTYLRIHRKDALGTGPNYLAFVSFDGLTWLFLGEKDLGLASAFDNVWLATISKSTVGDPVPIQAFHWIALGGQGIDPW